MVVDSEIEDDLLIISDGQKSNIEIWTLDLTCSHHYAPNQPWFAIYTKIDNRGVTLGDEHLYKVDGIMTIRVKIFDGIVWTLTNVKHAPELKKNLVWLGYLGRNSYNFSSNSGNDILNISKGAMVLIRRRLENNLYKMERSVVTGRFEIVEARCIPFVALSLRPHGSLWYEGAGQEWDDP